MFEGGKLTEGKVEKSSLLQSRSVPKANLFGVSKY
jgi:hypothetical protein